MFYRIKNISIDLAWKVIINSYFIFNSAQYIFKKFKPIVGYLFYKNSLPYLQFIKDYDIINEILIITSLSEKLKLNDKETEKYFNKMYFKYDFILYQFIEDENKKYSIRYNNINELFENKLQFVKSNIEFLTVILILNGTRYNIDLKTNTSYYIVNNKIFDFNFIKYYINKYYKLKIHDNDEYNIIILDNKCNTIHLNKNDYIILSENNYNVIYDENINKTKSEEEIENNIIDEITNQINDNDNEYSNNCKKSSNDSECENILDIECNNYNKKYSDMYYKYIKKTINFFYWTKYE